MTASPAERRIRAAAVALLGAALAACATPAPVPTGSALEPLPTVVFLLATSCLVAAANTLNCWIEVELDALMERTRVRPLPAGRMEPRAALISGVVLSVVSLGDLDGDGVGDLAVGATGDNDGGRGRGAVWVMAVEAT